VTPTLSNRLPARVDPNAIATAVEALHRHDIAFVDLTASNPTAVSLPYPDDLLAALADRRALSYDPHPFGLWSAREAVAADCARRGAAVDPASVVLAASTSESYAWLFKLLCSPGDAIVAPRPSYPLFEHLSRLEGVELATYDLQYHGRWEIDVDSLRRAPPRTRAVLLVSPNNPTGSFVSPRELDAVTTLSAERGWAIIADEVFADYTLDEDAPATDIAASADVLAFTLGGASKSLGLPQVKLGWIVAGGPRPQRERALEALALVADTYLSVGTPVQVAAPVLLHRGAEVRRAIHARVRANLDRARALAQKFPACEVYRVEGGWTAPIRVPATRSEEELVLALLEQERVLVHPGYFFDFPHEAFIVVSLLVEPDRFSDALERTLSRCHS
jgi:aspartate/methionine/tyrosine aminotransferase